MPVNKDILEKGLSVLKPFLYAYQEEIHDKLFETDLGKKVRDLNKKAKGGPALFVGLLGSLISSLETKSALGDLVKSLGTDSSGLMIRRMRKENLPPEEITLAEILLTMEPHMTKKLLAWAEKIDADKRQAFFALLSDLNEKQIGNFIALKTKDRQQVWDLMLAAKPQQQEQTVGQAKKTIDSFAQEFHAESEKLQTTLREKIIKARAKRQRR